MSNTNLGLHPLYLAIGALSSWKSAVPQLIKYTVFKSDGTAYLAGYFFFKKICMGKHVNSEDYGISLYLLPLHPHPHPTTS